MGDKLIESIKKIKFEKDDILVVRLKEIDKPENNKIIVEQLKSIIPKDLNVKIVISSPDIDLEIIRRNIKRNDKV